MAVMRILTFALASALLILPRPGFAADTAVLTAAPQTDRPRSTVGQVAAPAGLIAFCAREPGPCLAPGQTRVDLEVAVSAARTAYWQEVFASGGSARAGPSASHGRRRAVRADPPMSSHTGPLAVASVSQVDIDGDQWRRVLDINRTINRDVRQVSDWRQFAIADHWAIPRAEPNRRALGDCEDFVLGKRAALIAAGVPSAALSIALATTVWDEPHAVLLVSTDVGDYVLDNLRREVVHWSDADLTWERRQRPGNLLQWIDLSGV